MSSSSTQTPKAPRFSLVVSTRNRMRELENFFLHLDPQSYRDYEVVVVDQNANGAVPALLQRYDFRRQYVNSDKPGVASGRNIGLKLAQGDILAFPDDDCWYPPDLLETVARWFQERPDIDMLFVLECNEKGEAMVPKNPPSPGFCTDQPIGLFPERSAWLAQSSMVFLRRQVRDRIGVLNESIGVGSDTKYQSGEETDYLLRAMHAGFSLWFEPTIRVFHPELRDEKRMRKVDYPYSMGAGNLLRVHQCSRPRLMGVVCRALGGAAVSTCRGEFGMAMIYLRRAKGLLIGYFGW